MVMGSAKSLSTCSGRRLNDVSVDTRDLMRAVDALVRAGCGLKAVSSGSKIVEALFQANVCKSEAAGRAWIDTLVLATALRPVIGGGEHETDMYEVIGQEPGAALNDWFVVFPTKIRDARTLTDAFNRAVRPVMKAVVYNNGNNVHYDLLRTTPEWWDLLALVAEMKHVRHVGALEDAPKRAFLLNMLNVLIFHARTMRNPPTGLLSRGEYFQTIKYTLGGLTLNYPDFEHGVLRRKFATKKNASDQGIALMVQDVDARMHFALNCGAASCPSIRPYSAANLDAELECATMTYIQKEIVVDPVKRVIRLPRLMKWFRADFERQLQYNVDVCDTSLLTFVKQYVQPVQRATIETCKLKIDFRKYNWADNSRPDIKPEISHMAAYDASFFLQK